LFVLNYKKDTHRTSHINDDDDIKNRIQKKHSFITQKGSRALTAYGAKISNTS
jgi:hypothetical protein